MSFATLQLTEAEKIALTELLQEHTEKLQGLINHYNGNIEALISAGNEPDEQQRNYEAALQSNFDRKEIFTGIQKKLEQ